jgi:hypothetical protein
MFGAYKFRDLFSEINTAINPSIYAAGSVAGSPIPMFPWNKLVFELYTGSQSTAGTIQMWLLLGSGSTGLTSQGSSIPAYVMSTSANSAGAVAVLEVRGEYLANFAGSNFKYVVPVFSVSGGSANVMVTCHGFVIDYSPASLYDNPLNYVAAEVDLF